MKLTDHDKTIFNTLLKTYGVAPLLRQISIALREFVVHANVSALGDVSPLNWGHTEIVDQGMQSIAYTIDPENSSD